MVFYPKSTPAPLKVPIGVSYTKCQNRDFVIFFFFFKDNKEKAAAITLCRQLEDPIKNAVIDNLSIPIINSMRGSYSWIKTKPTFVAKVLLEIGNRLEENPSTGFSDCMDFVTNIYWNLSSRLGQILY